MAQETQREIAFDSPWGPVYKQEKDVGGYAKSEVPLGGCHPIVTAACRCETTGPMDCGCGFGQCARGLVF